MKVHAINFLYPIKKSPTFKSANITEPNDFFEKLTPTATVYKRHFNEKTGQTEKIPIKVTLEVIQKKPNLTQYILMDESEPIGYTLIQEWSKNTNISNHPDIKAHPELTKAHYKEGIVGERITIDMVQNHFPRLYSGIAEVSDQIAVEYCIKNKLPINIICVADYNSHLVHYKRGRRFLKLNSWTVKGRDFFEQYKTYNPNEILEGLSKNSRSRTVEMPALVNYMPKEVINKYLKKIKSSPILISI